jgi:DeoR/GlpR family transcriptional regulator of sugar metabolism
VYAVERRQEIATLIEDRGHGDVTELASRFESRLKRSAMT